MTTPTTAAKRPRRWFFPRFSLKMLMLAVTAAAVGAAFWWRWPVTQTTEKKQGSSVSQETFTYHRGLRGNLIKHGVHRITRDGKIIREEFFQEDILHGPFRQSWGMGSSTGAWYLGEKDGIWKYDPSEELPPEQRIRGEDHWNRGKRELMRRWDHTGKLSFGLQFKDGRLTGGEHCLSASLLAKRIAEGTLDDQKPIGQRGGQGGRPKQNFTLMDVLLWDVDLDYPETPLGEVLEDLQERFQIQIVPRWKRRTVELKPAPEPAEAPLPAMHEIPFSEEWILVEPDDPTAPPHLIDMRPRNLPPPAPPPPPVVWEIHRAPVTVNEKQIPFVAGMDAILSPFRLALDYRYGVLCVVDADGAADWQDSTGVMQLRPSPETSLAQRLDLPAEPTRMWAVWGILRDLGKDQGIDVELRMRAGYRVNLEDSVMGGRRGEVCLPGNALILPNLPQSNPKKPIPITLRQLLALLLDQANLHCHEENGVLVIEPPPETAPMQKPKP